LQKTDKDFIQIMQTIFEDGKKQSILEDKECFFQLFMSALDHNRVAIARWLIQQASLKYNVREAINRNVNFIQQLKVKIINQFRSLALKPHLTSDEMHSFYLKVAVLDLNSPVSFYEIMDIMKTSLCNSCEWPKDLNDLDLLDTDEVHDALKSLFILKEITIKKALEMNNLSSRNLLAIVLINEFLPRTLSNRILTNISIKLEEENKKIEEKPEEVMNFFSSKLYLSQFQKDFDKSRIPKFPFTSKIEVNTYTIELIEKIVHDKYLMDVGIENSENRLKLLDFDKKQIYSDEAILARARHKRLRKELTEENFDDATVHPNIRIKKLKRICDDANKSGAIPDLDLLHRNDDEPSYIHDLWNDFLSKSHRVDRSS
jgi:hypothetical protein